MVLPRELKRPQEAVQNKVPPLENGDHLDQPTFHARYEAMPEGVRAELIGGIVFMASPVRRRHMRGSGLAYAWLLAYEDETPGTEALNNGTIILDLESEPEPDAILRVLPEYGGRTQDEDDYVAGAPELVIEVASSSEAIDLNRKKADYERAGIDEYIVALLRGQEVRWFVLEEGTYRLLAPDTNGILRSRRFPGLWLEPQALLGGDRKRMLEVLREGLASPEHAEYVTRLAAGRQ
jgi:Uma2 family endonuclease